MEKQIASSLLATDSIECPAMSKPWPRQTVQITPQSYWLCSILDSSTVGIATEPIGSFVWAGQSVDVKVGLISNA
jgi:hypothetical protein